MESEVESLRERRDQRRLREPGDPDDEGVSPRQKGDEELLDDRGLAYDPARDLSLEDVVVELRARHTAPK